MNCLTERMHWKTDSTSIIMFLEKIWSVKLSGVVYGKSGADTLKWEENMVKVKSFYKYNSKPLAYMRKIFNSFLLLFFS